MKMKWNRIVKTLLVFACIITYFPKMQVFASTTSVRIVGDEGVAGANPGTYRPDTPGNKYTSWRDNLNSSDDFDRTYDIIQGSDYSAFISLRPGYTFQYYVDELTGSRYYSMYNDDTWNSYKSRTLRVVTSGPSGTSVRITGDGGMYNFGLTEYSNQVGAWINSGGTNWQIIMRTGSQFVINPWGTNDGSHFAYYLDLNNGVKWYDKNVVWNTTKPRNIKIITGAMLSIEYNANGGTNAPSNQTYIHNGKNINLSSQIPIRDGYTFLGWALDEKAIAPSYSAGQEWLSGNNANYKLYAVWKANTYAIEYNLNGGSASGNPTSYTKDSETFTLNNPTRTGYTFVGWTGSNGSTPQLNVTINKGSVGNKTYFASWSVNNLVFDYNPDFNKYGYITGSNMRILSFDLKVIKPDGLTFFEKKGIDDYCVTNAVYDSTYYFTNVVYKTGYGYAGYKISDKDSVEQAEDYAIDMKATGDSFTFKHTKNGNLWFSINTAPINYSISYDLDGGSASGNRTSYTIESETFTLNNPTKANSKFMGWTGSNGSIPQLNITINKGSVGNKDYVANWFSSEDLKLVSRVESSCVKEGNIEHYYSEKYIKYFSDKDGLNEITKEQTIIEKLPHQLVHHDKVEATCTSKGYIEYSQCSACGKYFDVGNNEITKDKLFIDMIEHKYDLGSIILSASCNRAGIIRYTCNVCGQTKTQEIPKIEHSPNKFFQADVNNHWHTCDVCKEHLDVTKHTDSNLDNVCDICKHTMSLDGQVYGYAVDTSLFEDSVVRDELSEIHIKLTDKGNELYINNKLMSVESDNEFNAKYINGIREFILKFDIAKRNVNITYHDNALLTYQTLFEIRNDNNKDKYYLLAYKNQANRNDYIKVNSSEDSDYIYFDTFNIAYANEDDKIKDTIKEFNIRLNKKSKELIVNGVNKGLVRESTEHIIVYMEYHVNAHPLNIDYLAKGEKYGAFGTYLEATSPSFLSDGKIENLVSQESITLRATKYPDLTKNVPLRRTIRFWDRLPDGSYDTSHKVDVQVVCKYEDYKCESVRQNSPKYYSVFGDSESVNDYRWKTIEKIETDKIVEYKLYQYVASWSNWSSPELSTGLGLWYNTDQAKHTISAGTYDVISDWKNGYGQFSTGSGWAITPINQQYRTRQYISPAWLIDNGYGTQYLTYRPSNTSSHYYSCSTYNDHSRPQYGSWSGWTTSSCVKNEGRDCDFKIEYRMRRYTLSWGSWSGYDYWSCSENETTQCSWNAKAKCYRKIVCWECSGGKVCGYSASKPFPYCNRRNDWDYKDSGLSAGNSCTSVDEYYVWQWAGRYATRTATKNYYWSDWGSDGCSGSGCEERWLYRSRSISYPLGYACTRQYYRPESWSNWSGYSSNPTESMCGSSEGGQVTYECRYQEKKSSPMTKTRYGTYGWSKSDKEDYSSGREKTKTEIITKYLAKPLTKPYERLPQVTQSQIDSYANELGLSAIRYQKSGNGNNDYDSVYNVTTEDRYRFDKLWNTAISDFKKLKVYIPWIYINDHWRADDVGWDMTRYKDNIVNNEIIATGYEDIWDSALNPIYKPFERKVDVIYFDKKDPFFNYNTLPKNWQAQDELIKEIKNANFDNPQIEVTLSKQDINDIQDYLNNGGYQKLGTCDILRKFKHIFTTKDFELDKFLDNSKDSCRY
ncbi:MAG: InlB B-repeat-containing protein [Erysipelotrichaceae bacterium]